MDIAAIQAKEIRDYYQRSYGRVNPPATEKEILRAEKKIGKPLPQMLQELYRLCNGFFSNVNEPLLMPLDMMVTENKKFWKYTPSRKDEGYICFGYFEGWRDLAMRELPAGNIHIISYDANTDRRFQDRGPDLLALYQGLERWKHAEVFEDSAAWDDEWNLDRKKRR